MPERNIYKYAEKCLYDYPMNLSRLKVLNEDLRVLRAGSDVHAQQYDKLTGQYYIAYDPVASYVEKLDRLESQIKRIERNSVPITSLIQDLNTPNATDKSKYLDYVKILELYYFGANPLDIVAQELHCSRSTLFYKHRELVRLTIGYLGLTSFP